jgi:hypothetical protein
LHWEIVLVVPHMWPRHKPVRELIVFVELTCNYGREKETIMRTNLIARIAAIMLVTSALTGCFSSSKEVVHDKPVYVEPAPATVVVPPAQPSTP